MNIDIREKLVVVLDVVGGKGRYYIFGALLLLVFFFDYVFLMRPQFTALSKINPEIKTVSDQINNAKEDMTKLDSYRKDLQNMSSKFAEAKVSVRSRDEVPMILEHIANVASETGVRIDQIMPDTLDQELLTENNQIKYFDLPIFLEARCGYHSLGRFLNRLDTEDISLRVGAFSVSSTNDLQHHLVKLTLKATVFEEVAQ